ncbi:MAG: hypothetical protein UY24_C0014G0004 [Parcubacteria group bacterium GW2011_GWA1_48_11b]|nr:MAG: hypothetical protein UY24_C0014G0004 [Parcubacteria group bacterium GW2011_GWA1_48_11b]
MIGLAFLVGVLYVAPELLIWNKLHSLGKPYVAIQLSHHGDEAQGTISRFREIYDGHFPPGDLFLDNANAPTPFGPIQVMPALMAGFIALFGGNINVSYLFATFILSPIVFLLFYWLGKVITGNRIYAVFFALLGVMTPIFRALPRAFESLALFFNNIGNYFIPLIRTPMAKLPLGRTEDPLLTYLVFLPAIAALLLFWKRPSWKTGAAVGSLIGLMFYVYFHYWVFLVVIAGLIGAYSLFKILPHRLPADRHGQADKSNKNLFKSVLVLFAVLALVTIPYWVNYFNFKNSPTGEELTLRIGITKSHAPFFIAGEPEVLAYVFYALLAIVVYFVFYKRGQKNTAVLYWIFTAAMFIAWNIQVVTGFVPAADHWYRTIGAFFTVIVFHAAFELLKKVNYKVVAVVLIIGSSFLVIKKIVNALVFVNPPPQFIDGKSFESRAFNPSIVESWDWINKNLPNEPKIISPSFITSMYLYTETSTRPYFVYGFNTSASNKLLEERFLTTYRLFNVKQEFLKRILELDYSNGPCSPEHCADSPAKDMNEFLNTVEVIPHLYFGYYANYYYDRGLPQSVTTYRFVSKEKADELLARYPKVTANWEDIEADYVYYGPWERQITQIDLSKNPNLELVFKNQEVEIYKIKK